MDPDSLAATISNKPRKVKFQPKGPPRREQRPLVLPKSEKVEDDVDAANKEDLLRLFNKASERNVKAERKVAPSMVAFGPGASSSLRSYGSSKGNKFRGSSSNGDGTEEKVKKEYKEPWDYSNSIYPVTLPLRPPYSGDPELLDEEEFGEASESLKYDEYASNSAIELGLMEENPEPRLLFFQLPADLPMFKPSSTSEGNGAASSSKTSKSSGTTHQTACHLDELPAGFMGKMLVYKSGAVKLKLGDTLYDVTAGMDCLMAQDAVAINTEAKECTVVGEVNKRAIITPDVDSVLDSILKE